MTIDNRKLAQNIYHLLLERLQKESEKRILL